MTASFDSGNECEQRPSREFLRLGLLSIVYIKPVIVDHARAYAIHSADGIELAVVADRHTAYVTARQHDVEWVSVH